jgi:hypothetical protein
MGSGLHPEDQTNIVTQQKNKCRNNDQSFQDWSTANFRNVFILHIPQTLDNIQQDCDVMNQLPLTEIGVSEIL